MRPAGCGTPLLPGCCPCRPAAHPHLHAHARLCGPHSPPKNPGAPRAGLGKYECCAHTHTHPPVGTAPGTRRWRCPQGCRARCRPGSVTPCTPKSWPAGWSSSVRSMAGGGQRVCVCARQEDAVGCAVREVVAPAVGCRVPGAWKELGASSGVSLPGPGCALLSLHSGTALPPPTCHAMPVTPRRLLPTAAAAPATPVPCPSVSAGPGQRGRESCKPGRHGMLCAVQSQARAVGSEAGQPVDSALFNTPTFAAPPPPPQKRHL